MQPFCVCFFQAHAAYLLHVHVHAVCHHHSAPRIHLAEYPPVSPLLRIILILIDGEVLCSTEAAEAGTCLSADCQWSTCLIGKVRDCHFLAYSASFFRGFFLLRRIERRLFFFMYDVGYAISRYSASGRSRARQCFCCDASGVW